MDGSGNLKLADLGFAKLVFEGGRAYTVCGTPDYLAPEVIEHRGATRGSDYWALGILIFEFISGCVGCALASCCHAHRRNPFPQLSSIPRRAEMVPVQEDLHRPHRVLA